MYLKWDNNLDKELIQDVIYRLKSHKRLCNTWCLFILETIHNNYIFFQDKEFIDKLSLQDQQDTISFTEYI